MSLYTLAIILLILILAITAGFLVPTTINPMIPLVFVATLAVIGSVLVALSGILEGYLHDFLSRGFRRAGYTMPRVYSRLLTLSLIVTMMLSIALLLLLYLLILAPGASLTLVRLLLAISLLILITGLASISIVVVTSPRLISSFRASGALVELPFLLATLRIFSKTHLTLYDMLKLVESSYSLKWWSSEVRRREDVARERGVSLVTAFNMLSEEHPSLEVRDVVRRISLAGLYAGSPAGVVERVSQQYFDLLRSRLERLTGYMYIALGIALITLFLIPVLAITLGPVLRIPPSTVAIAALATALPIFLIAYTLIQAMYPNGFMLNASQTIKILYVISIAVLLGAVMATLYSQLKGLPLNSMLAYSIAIASLVPATAVTLAYLARVSAYERLVRIVSDATELASVTGENLVSLMRRVGGGDRRVRRLIDDIERAIVDDSVRVKLVSQAPSMLYASMVENIVYALRIGAPLTVFAEIASVYEQLKETLRRHQNAMRGVELTIAVIILAISLFTAVMIRILSGIAESVKTPVGASIPSILQQFMIAQDPTLLYATITSMIIASVVTGALVEKAKTGTIVTSARTILAYTLLSLAGIAILTVIRVVRLPY